MEQQERLQQLERLVAERQDWLFRFAYMRIGVREDAEDVVQDTFLRVYRKLEMLHDVENLQAYLTRSITNACQDYFRRRSITTIELSRIEQLPDVPTDAGIHEEFQRINRMLDGLPEEQAETVRLHCIDELTFREIAQLYGVPEPTIKSRYRYAIAHIQKQLNRKENKR